MALLLLLGAERAPAQEVSVRAGEHGGFTRLVLRVPEEGEWTLGPAPGGFEVRGPAGAEFDTRGAFRRIGRDRIAALRPRPGGRLGLDIACACHAEMFRMEGVGLVLDVIDGPPPPGALAPGPAAPAAAAALPTLPLLLAPGPPPFLPNPLDAALTAPPALPPEEEDRVARTEAAILDSVAEAARHGFLDLAPGTRPERAEEDLAAEGARILQPGDARDGRPGVGVRTGLEQDRGTPLSATGAACLAEEDFDLAGWAGGGDFVIEVPARLAALTDARDRLDPVAAEALARTYLAYGFGREARVALDLDGRSSRGRDVLRTLARLMDGEPVPVGTFADQAGCLGPVALWRALARGTLSGNDERERTAMTLALRALPKGARDAVALRLAGLFLDASDAAGAQAIAELSSPAGGEALLARAEIVGVLDGPAFALAELEAAAESDARMTPEAMAELLDLLVEEGRPVGEDTLELARALRFEHGGSRGLLLAEARALTAGERFEEALALLDGERATAPGEDLDRALAATVAALTERLEDAPFLELALSGLPEALPLDARETVARRLSALGFPDEAWALRNATNPAVPRSSVPALDPAAWVPRPENPAPPLSVPEPPVPVAEAQAASPTSPPLSLLSAEPMEQAEASAAALGVAGPLPGPVPPALVAAAPAPPTAVAAMPAVPPSAEVVVPEAPPPFVVEEAGDASAILVPPFPAPLADATGSGMTLAQRRALLAQAEDVRARAAALLGQELGQ